MGRWLRQHHAAHSRDTAMRSRDVSLAVFVMMIWGFNFVAIKWGLAELPPMFLIALRFALVASILLPFVRFPRGHLKHLLVLSVTLGTLHFSLMFTGLARVDAGTASIVTQTQVPFGALLAAIFFRERFGLRHGLGLAVALVGVAVLAGGPGTRQDLGAVALIIAAALFWALANIQIKLMGPVDGLSVNAYLGLLCAPQLLLSSLLFEDGQWEALMHAGMNLVWSLVYMIGLVTIVSHTVWYHLLQRLAVNQAMPFMLLSPVFAVLFGILILDEPFGWRVALGGLLTVSGVGVILFAPKAKGPAELPRPARP